MRRYYVQKKSLRKTKILERKKGTKVFCAFRGGNASIEFVSLGRWWGNDPIKKAQAEIDIMGERDSESALFAECKWRNEKVDLDILETLIGRSKLFRYTKVHYYLFSKSGFTKGCMEKAEEMGNVTLVSYADIIGAMRNTKYCIK